MKNIASNMRIYIILETHGGFDKSGISGAYKSSTVLTTSQRETMQISAGYNARTMSAILQRASVQDRCAQRSGPSPCVSGFPVT